MKVIISGGGTGGHIYPALSIADGIRRRHPDAAILFIGAQGRMEMQRVPEAGYEIIGLPVSGFNRASKWKNFGVAIRLLKSLFLAWKCIRRFKPDVAVGVGGYASAATLRVASTLSIPTVIQEQNSYAGMTNKLLAKHAAKICVAYRGMNKFFPEERIILTGNPVRKDLETPLPKTDAALQYFGLNASKPVLLLLGGSLGARTINNGIRNGLENLLKAGVQVIWQTGKAYYEEIYEDFVAKRPHGLWASEFISRMDYAYAVADLVVSRAGAGTISELCLQHKPSILVPSPNVAEDHQTMNAMALADVDAAIVLPDKEAEEKIVPLSLSVIFDSGRLRSLSDNIATLAQHNSADRIVDEIEKSMEEMND
jgi:UDP-N-acetylglucosamine--N-acetylmuramyl-(pentapeptide) pyrophosphoryl-undecaprenol N-acetylglucosamine transferase